MKAVVLVGGEGTRLRPLTETMPKPLVPLMDRPSLDHVLDHLARHGVHEVVLSSPYLEEMFHPFIESRHGRSEDHLDHRDRAARHGRGHRARARHARRRRAVLRAERRHPHRPGSHRDARAPSRARRAGHDRACTTSRTPGRSAWSTPSPTGGSWSSGRSPTDPIPGDINAGTYLLDPVVLAPWTAGAQISIEREVFPAVIEAGHPVFGFLSDAYWLDLGTPAKYLQAHFDMLEGKVHGVSYPSPWVDPTADVDLRAHLGRWVAVGPEAAVGAEAQVDDSVIHRGGTIEAGARVVASVVGPGRARGRRSDPHGMRSGRRVLGSRRAPTSTARGCRRARRRSPSRCRVGPDRRGTVPIPTEHPSHATHPSLRARRGRLGGHPARGLRPRGRSHHALRQRLGARARPLPVGRVRVGERRLDVDADPHPLLQRHEGLEDRPAARRHPRRAGHGRARAPSDGGGRTGAPVRQATGRRHVGRQDPRRRDVGRAIRGRRVRGA